MAPELSNEVWCMISKFCDMDMLLALARTSRRHQSIAVHELQSRCRRAPDLLELLVSRFQMYLTELAASDPIYYIPSLCRALGHQVRSWDVVAAYPAPVMQRYLEADLIDHRNVCDEWLTTMSNKFAKVRHNIQFNLRFIEDPLRCLPPLLLYRIWQVAFLTSVDYGEEAKLQQSAKTGIEARKWLIGVLTDNVMTVFRSTLIINDRFVLKCFEHDLDNILLYLYENPQFFNLSISTPKLEDLYIMLACETGSITMFLRLVKKVRKIHIEYAMRHASSDFLMLIWKSRSYIAHFHDYIQAIQADLDRPLALREFKERRFLEWCTTHP